MRSIRSSTSSLFLGVGAGNKPESFVPRKDFLQFAQGNEKSTPFHGGWVTIVTDGTVCFHHRNHRLRPPTISLCHCVSCSSSSLSTAVFTWSSLAMDLG